MKGSSTAVRVGGVELPVIEELSDKAYLVHEFPLLPEWIPDWNYDGVVRELKEEISDYHVKFVYIPSSSGDLLVYLPPLQLPSGFDATPLPVSIRKQSKSAEPNFELKWGVDNAPVYRDHVYSFDQRGEVQGLWGSDGGRMGKYVDGLKRSLESAGTETMGGINALRLMKFDRTLSYAAVERAQRLLKKHGFGATFDIRSHQPSHRNRSIGQWEISTDSKARIVLAGSYKSRDEMHDGNPRSLSIVLSSGNSMLTGDDLKVLEEFCHLF
jgi:hypothetical protein